MEEIEDVRVSRDALDRLYHMRPGEMREFLMSRFPGSGLAHMHPREIEGIVSAAHRKAGLHRARIMGPRQAAASLAAFERHPRDPEHASWRAILPDIKSPSGSKRRDVRSMAHVQRPNSLSPAPAGTVAGRGAAPRHRASKRAPRKRARSAKPRTLLGLPWLQTAGILFGIVVGVIMAAAAFFR